MLAIGATLEERVELYRAAMAVIVDAMASFDDSGADMAMTYEDIERASLGAQRELPGRAALLTDRVEVATWDDYGLAVGVEDFLAGLTESRRRGASSAREVDLRAEGRAARVLSRTSAKPARGGAPCGERGRRFGRMSLGGRQ